MIPTQQETPEKAQAIAMAISHLEKVKAQLDNGEITRAESDVQSLAVIMILSQI
jgi:hypothetical protein